MPGLPGRFVSCTQRYCEHVRAPRKTDSVGATTPGGAFHESPLNLQGVRIVLTDSFGGPCGTVETRRSNSFDAYRTAERSLVKPPVRAIYSRDRQLPIRAYLTGNGQARQIWRPRTSRSTAHSDDGEGTDTGSRSRCELQGKYRKHNIRELRKSRGRQRTGTCQAQFFAGAKRLKRQATRKES